MNKYNLNTLCESTSEEEIKFIRDNFTSIETELIETASFIQSASNGIAVARSLHMIFRILYKAGLDSPAMHRHPAVKAIIGKLCSLCDMEHDGAAAYNDLYTALKKVENS